MTEIWILGATGKTGSRIAALVATDPPPDADLCLVGRRSEALERLKIITPDLGTAAIRTLGTVPAMAEAIRATRPSVVVNTVGPYRTSAPWGSRRERLRLPDSTTVDTIAPQRILRRRGEPRTLTTWWRLRPAR
ncbi:MAG: hypothetical protein WAV45_04490 [Propionibacteriaceae bacterium]|nr:hypothetical protein [Micropruina sp.]